MFARANLDDELVWRFYIQRLPREANPSIAEKPMLIAEEIKKMQYNRKKYTFCDKKALKAHKTCVKRSPRESHRT